MRRGIVVLSAVIALSTCPKAYSGPAAKSGTKAPALHKIFPPDDFTRVHFLDNARTRQEDVDRRERKLARLNKQYQAAVSRKQADFQRLAYQIASLSVKQEFEHYRIWTWRTLAGFPVPASEKDLLAKKAAFERQAARRQEVHKARCLALLSQWKAVVSDPRIRKKFDELRTKLKG